MAECNANPEPVFLAYRAHPQIDAIVNSVRSGPPAIDFIASDGIGHTVWVIRDGDAAPEAPEGQALRAGKGKAASPAGRGAPLGAGPAETLGALPGAGMVAELVRLFAEVPCLYVADGHHRTASAARHAQAMRARNPRPRGDEPYESFMAVLFPHDQLRILDYNRLVRDLNGLRADQLLAKAGERFFVSPASPVMDAGRGARPAPRLRSERPTGSLGPQRMQAGAGMRPPLCRANGRHDRGHPAAAQASLRSFGMFLEGRWYRLEAKPGTFPADDPIGGLDISILQENLLAPVLGIGDQRTDKRIDFVGGIRGMGELEKRCREGWAVAFALSRPPSTS